jgi:hypothetical protein
MMAKSTHETRMQLAIAELDTQSIPNYSSTARKHELVRSTLTRRHQCQTQSRAEALSDHSQRLTNAEEEVLIGHINRLTDRALPPTSQIVKNMAEEICGSSVGKNWTSAFIRRHPGQLKSAYLRNIANLRAKADNASMFQLFYDQV